MRRCTARTRAGNPCRLAPVRGALVCCKHGGAAPQVKARAAVRAEVMAWGLDAPDVDPGETLLKLVAQSAARAHRYATELEQLVAESPNLRDALVGEARGEFGPIGEYIRGLAQLEAAERDRCANFAAKAVAAGLNERMVRLAERQGDLIAAVLQAVVDDPDLSLSKEQRRAMPAVIRRHLTAVS